MRVINLHPKNFATKKLYEKEVRELHQGIIQPYAAESQGRVLRWYDCFVKKTIMVNTVVFLYDWPLVASGVLVGFGVVDCVIMFRDWTGIRFLNFLVFFEALGFLAIFMMMPLLHLDIFDTAGEETLGSVFIILLGVVLGGALLGRLMHFPIMRYHEVDEQKLKHDS
jgi:hypothetical protein